MSGKLGFDAYVILGITSTATPDQIRVAYKKKALATHPDKNRGLKDAEDRFKEVAEAYATLNDPAARAAYDRSRSSRSNSSTAATTSVPRPSEQRRQQSQRSPPVSRAGTRSPGNRSPPPGMSRSPPPSTGFEIPRKRSPSAGHQKPSRGSSFASSASFPTDSGFGEDTPMFFAEPAHAYEDPYPPTFSTSPPTYSNGHNHGYGSGPFPHHGFQRPFVDPYQMFDEIFRDVEAQLADAELDLPREFGDHFNQPFFHHPPDPIGRPSNGLDRAFRDMALDDRPGSVPPRMDGRKKGGWDTSDLRRSQTPGVKRGGTPQDSGTMGMHRRRVSTTTRDGFGNESVSYKDTHMATMSRTRRMSVGGQEIHTTTHITQTFTTVGQDGSSMTAEAPLRRPRLGSMSTGADPAPAPATTMSRGGAPNRGSRHPPLSGGSRTPSFTHRTSPSPHSSQAATTTPPAHASSRSRRTSVAGTNSVDFPGRNDERPIPTPATGYVVPKRRLSASTWNAPRAVR